MRTCRKEGQLGAQEGEGELPVGGTPGGEQRAQGHGGLDPRCVPLPAECSLPVKSGLEWNTFGKESPALPSKVEGLIKMCHGRIQDGIQVKILFKSSS